MMEGRGADGRAKDVHSRDSVQKGPPLASHRPFLAAWAGPGPPTQGLHGLHGLHGLQGFLGLCLFGALGGNCPIASGGSGTGTESWLAVSHCPASSGRQFQSAGVSAITTDVMQISAGCLHCSLAAGYPCHQPPSTCYAARPRGLLTRRPTMNNAFSAEQVMESGG